MKTKNQFGKLLKFTFLADPRVRSWAIFLVVFKALGILTLILDDVDDSLISNNHFSYLVFPICLCGAIFNPVFREFLWTRAMDRRIDFWVKTIGFIVITVFSTLILEYSAALKNPSISIIVNQENATRYLQKIEGTYQENSYKEKATLVIPEGRFIAAPFKIWWELLCVLIILSVVMWSSQYKHGLITRIFIFGSILYMFLIVVFRKPLRWMLDEIAFIFYDHQFVSILGLTLFTIAALFFCQKKFLQQQIL